MKSEEDVRSKIADLEWERNIYFQKMGPDIKEHERNTKQLQAQSDYLKLSGKISLLLWVVGEGE